MPTTVAGELIADAIATGDQRYTVWQKHFPLKFTGAPLVSGVVVQLMYWAYQAHDAFKIWQSKL